MNCQRYETGLLLLVHQAAGPIQTWWLRRHLKTCIACQARYAQMRSASIALADGIRGGSDLPPWRPPIGATSSARAALWLRPIAAPTLLAGAAAVAGAAAIGYQVYVALNPPPVACPTPIVATPPPIAQEYGKAAGRPHRYGYGLKTPRDGD